MIFNYASHIKNLLLIICWSFAQLFKTAPKKDKVKRMLCILDLSGVGDTVCVSDALYTLWLSTRGKVELYIAGPKAAIHLLKTCKLAPDAHWIELDMEGDQKYSFSIFRCNHEKISRYHWDCITKMDILGSYMRLLFLGCQSNKIFAMNFIESHLNILDRLAGYYIKNLEMSYFPCDTFILEYNKVLIDKSIHFMNLKRSDTSYKEYVIPVFDESPLQNHLRRYCIICPSVSTAVAHFERERKWPLNRFVQISDFILDNSNISIVLCGVMADKEDNGYVVAHCKDSSRIIDMTGKTTFSQWIELIRNANFILGNDSGYIHLAAYLKVPSFVISGYWNYGNYLPYHGKNIETKVIPIDIRLSRPACSSCRRIKVGGADKTECDRLVREKGVYKCVWDISVKQVEKVLKDSHILENINK